MLKLLIPSLALVLATSMAHAGNHGNAGARLGKLRCEAGQIAQFDGRQWRCADLPLGGAGNFQVFDSSEPPKQVGTLVEFVDSDIVPNQGADVLMEFKGLVVKVSVEPDEFRGTNTIAFDSDDCTGDAFAILTQELNPILLGAHAYVQRSEPGIDQILYVSDGDTFVGTFDGSFIQTGGACEALDGGSEPLLVPIVPVLDLAEEFTPPFRVLKVAD